MRMNKSRYRPKTSKLLTALLLGTCLSPMSLAFLPTAVFAQAAVQHINIPALPLAEALNVLSAQTGLQIAFSNADVAGISAPAVSGASSPKATLNQLLAGTDLSAFFVNARMVSITTSARTDAGLPIDNGSLLLDAITITGGGQEYPRV